jgi:hypothetical protein
VSKSKETEILKNISRNLKAAERHQPCPACKHDIRLLNKFVLSKLASIETDSDLTKKERKTLEAVDFINEMTNAGIAVAKRVSPLTRKIAVPSIYGVVLLKERQANEDTKKDLVSAFELISQLNQSERDYKHIADVLSSFIKAVNFKLSIDPTLFYVFDKVIRLGYKTKILNITGYTIIMFKKLKRSL